jgi:hypothetical protein
MAITTAMCSSFKQELLGGVHDLDTDTLKIALIKASPTGTYGAATTNYSDVTGNSDESSGSGYSAGGGTLDSPVISLSGTTAFVDFADEAFSNVTVSADGCIIYNSSQSNKAIAVFDFGGTVSATSGTLTVQFPTADATNAVIRLT